MKQTIRNKVIFKGTPGQLTSIVPALGTGEGEQCFLPERIIPLDDNSEGAMKAAWGISSRPEEADYVLYRSQTILEYTFDTEDNAPMPLFHRLAERFPDVLLRIEYASHDYGEEVGLLEAPEGKHVLEMREIDDPLVFACDLWGVDPEEEMAERMINQYEE